MNRMAGPENGRVQNRLISRSMVVTCSKTKSAERNHCIEPRPKRDTGALTYSKLRFLRSSQEC